MSLFEACRRTAPRLAGRLRSPHEVHPAFARLVLVGELPVRSFGLSRAANSRAESCGAVSQIMRSGVFNLYGFRPTPIMHEEIAP